MTRTAVPAFSSPPYLPVFVLLPHCCCPRPHPLDPFSDDRERCVNDVICSLRGCCHPPAAQGKDGAQVACKWPVAVQAPAEEGTKGTKVGCWFGWCVLTCVNGEHLSEENRVPTHSVEFT
jgi:hypothetical protein